MKKLVVLTGAGISADSGLKTFRDSDGLWENHDVMDVASNDGWERNPQLVLEFYNMRRKQLLEAKPNAAHLGLKKLEKYFDVQIITQNVDNLHEQAGSQNVLHLHGELMKVRSIDDESTVMDVSPEHAEVNWGDTSSSGSQLRPHIVFFGEAVPAMDDAIPLCQGADLIAVIGTSMVVYPAAGLVHYAPKGIPMFLLDPGQVDVPGFFNMSIIQRKAAEGIELFIEKIMHYA